MLHVVKLFSEDIYLVRTKKAGGKEYTLYLLSLTLFDCLFNSLVSSADNLCKTVWTQIRPYIVNPNQLTL